MFNSKLKLQGLSLEEIIHEGIHGNNPEVSIDDWKFIESLLGIERDEANKLNYDRGWQDGNDQAWNMIYGDEED